MNDTSQQTIKIAVRLFLKGEYLVYKGVEFSREKDRALLICNYCECNPEDANSEMAMDRFKRAKATLAELSEKSTEFKEVAQKMPHEHYFLYYHGKGSIVLAKEIKGLFESDFPSIS